MIEKIWIESDEDGWHLILDVDLDDETIRAYIADPFRPLNLRLSQEAAWGLIEAVRPVAEWRAEGEAQKRNVELGRPPCGHDGWVEGCAYCERETARAIEAMESSLDRAAALGAPDEILSEGIAREQADLERKRRKENP